MKKFLNFIFILFLISAAQPTISIRQPKWELSSPVPDRNTTTTTKTLVPNLQQRIEYHVRFFNNITELTTANPVLRDKHDISQEEENMERPSFFPRYSLLFQVLIFICSAAGVSVVLILCCLICLHTLQFFSRSTLIVGDDGRIHMSHIQIQQNANNETVLTFIPSHHRHPWSSGNEENERFTFQLNNDLPPSYDDLPPKEEETISSPPPPYTPSFKNAYHKLEQ